MKIPIKYILTGFIVLLSVVFILGRRSVHNRIESALEAVIDAQKQLKVAAKTYDIYIKGQKQTITEQRTLIMTKDQALDAEILSKEKYKKLHLRAIRENIRLQGMIEVLKDSLNIEVPPDTIIIHDTITGYYDTYMKVPWERLYTDEYIALGLHINEDASWGFDLSMPLNLDVTLGDVKTGFLRSEPSVVINPNSPYIGDIKVQSIKIEENKPWFKTTWFKLLSHGGMFVGGYYLGSTR